MTWDTIRQTTNDRGSTAVSKHSPFELLTFLQLQKIQ